jgi:hypothetical protein
MAPHVADLSEMGGENRAPVVVHENCRVVNDRVAGLAEGQADLRVLASIEAAGPAAHPG